MRRSHRHSRPARPGLPAWMRLVAAALAFWLAPALLDGPALHACPMHDAVPAMAGMPGMPGMPAGGVAGAGLPAHDAHDAHVHGCTCLGACALAGAALPPATADVAVALGDVGTSLPPGAPAWRPRGATSHFLPFAHAPPQA